MMGMAVMARPRGREGFTILELLVVIGLIGMITTWGYVILFRVDSDWKELRSRSEINDAASAMFQTMRDDFNASVSPKLAGVALAATHAMYSDTDRHRELFNDSFEFPIAAPDAQGVSRVRYFVERTLKRDFLTREVLPLSGEAASPMTNELNRLVDVVYLRCEVGVEQNGEFAWTQDGWSGSEPPEAVRISMTLADPDSPWIQVSRKAVFDVRVD